MIDVLILTCCLFTTTAASYVGRPDHRGKQFIFGYLDNYSPITPEALELYITTDVPGNWSVNVTFPLDSAGEPYNLMVSNGSSQMIYMNPYLRMSGNAKEDKGIYIQAEEEVVVYAVNKELLSADGFLVLPVDVLGTEYVVSSWQQTRNNRPSLVGTVATEDTVVNFTFPTGSNIQVTWGGVTYGGGDTLSVSCNKFQTIQVSSDIDLTGTIVTSRNPIAVNGGNKQASIYGLPSYTDANGKTWELSADHLEEMFLPVPSVGKEYVTAPIAMRSAGDVFRIIGARDGTTFNVTNENGLTTHTLEKGQFVELNVSSTSFQHIVADKQIVVVQYCKTGNVEPTNSDPFMMVLPSIEQFDNTYTTSTSTGLAGNYENYVTVVIRSENIGGLLVDNEPLNQTSLGYKDSYNWTAIPMSDYSACALWIEDGTHSFAHSDPTATFAIYAYGHTAKESYGYSGGFRMALLYEFCSNSAMTPGDGIDNDCDNRIDEELWNDLDDDGDGLVDEDLALDADYNVTTTTETATTQLTSSSQESTTASATTTSQQDTVTSTTSDTYTTSTQDTVTSATSDSTTSNQETVTSKTSDTTTSNQDTITSTTSDTTTSNQDTLTSTTSDTSTSYQNTATSTTSDTTTSNQDTATPTTSDTTASNQNTITSTTSNTKTNTQGTVTLTTSDISTSNQDTVTPTTSDTTTSNQVTITTTTSDATTSIQDTATSTTSDTTTSNQDTLTSTTSDTSTSYQNTATSTTSDTTTSNQDTATPTTSDTTASNQNTITSTTSNTKTNTQGTVTLTTSDISTSNQDTVTPTTSDTTTSNQVTITTTTSDATTSIQDTATSTTSDTTTSNQDTLTSTTSDTSTSYQNTATSTTSDTTTSNQDTATPTTSDTTASNQNTITSTTSNTKTNTQGTVTLTTSDISTSNQDTVTPTTSDTTTSNQVTITTTTSDATTSIKDTATPTTSDTAISNQHTTTSQYSGATTSKEDSVTSITPETTKTSSESSTNNTLTGTSTTSGNMTPNQHASTTAQADKTTQNSKSVSRPLNTSSTTVSQSETTSTMGGKSGIDPSTVFTPTMPNAVTGVTSGVVTSVSVTSSTSRAPLTLRPTGGVTNHGVTVTPPAPPGGGSPLPTLSPDLVDKIKNILKGIGITNDTAIDIILTKIRNSDRTPTGGNDVIIIVCTVVPTCVLVCCCCGFCCWVFVGKKKRKRRRQVESELAHVTSGEEDDQDANGNVFKAESHDMVSMDGKWARSSREMLFINNSRAKELGFTD